MLRADAPAFEPASFRSQTPCIGVSSKLARSRCRIGDSEADFLSFRRPNPWCDVMNPMDNLKSTAWGDLTRSMAGVSPWVSPFTMATDVPGGGLRLPQSLLNNLEACPEALDLQLDGLAQLHHSLAELMDDSAPSAFASNANARSDERFCQSQLSDTLSNTESDSTICTLGSPTANSDSTVSSMVVSIGHEEAICTKPVCIFVSRDGGCTHGANCLFCHECTEKHSGEKAMKSVRPCKGKRDRYRKIFAKLVERAEQEPDFDFESQKLPPFLETNEFVKSKLATRMEGHMARARSGPGDQGPQKTAQANNTEKSLIELLGLAV